MKVKMRELVQGVNISGELLYEGITVSILEKELEYNVSQKLGEWLIENHKAELMDVVLPPVMEEAPVGVVEAQDVMNTSQSKKRVRYEKNKA